MFNIDLVRCKLDVSLKRKERFSAVDRTRTQQGFQSLHRLILKLPAKDQVSLLQSYKFTILFPSPPSGMRSASWTTGGSSYEPSRSVTSTKTPVFKTTGWLRPSCTATRLRGCSSRCGSRCATAPAFDRRPPPAERRSRSSTNRPTPRGSWRGLGLLRYGMFVYAHST